MWWLLFYLIAGTSLAHICEYTDGSKGLRSRRAFVIILLWPVIVGALIERIYTKKMDCTITLGNWTWTRKRKSDETN